VTLSRTSSTSHTSPTSTAATCVPLKTVSANVPSPSCLKYNAIRTR
jgi:hypothetical protein